MLRRFRPLLEAEVDAVELCDFRRDPHWGNSVVVTCEHASNRLPSPYQWSEKDSVFSDTHWAWDLGAADTARLLADTLQTMLVMSRFSRLLLDANRLLYAETMFRKTCDGVTLDLNSALTPQERYQRIFRFHVPYHLLAGEVTEFLDPSLVISIHTFTPKYEGEVREVEVGVLFEDCDEELALYTQKRLIEAGFNTKLNEPWSGKAGLMPVVLGLKFASLSKPRDAIELEIRNDLASVPEFRQRIVDVLVSIAEHQVKEKLRLL